MNKEMNDVQLIAYFLEFASNPWKSELPKCGITLV
jgi:hypothetical protein